MHEDKRLEIKVQVFLGRENIVVGELDKALEVLAAALGVELKPMLMHEMCLVFMLMLMLQTMLTSFSSIDETACQMMVFGAIVEFHVPTH